MVDGLDEATLRKSIPMNRFGTPEEVADVVGFLLHRPHLTSQEKQFP